MVDAARTAGPTGPRLVVAATPAVALIAGVPFASGARTGIVWLLVGLALVAGSAVVLVLLDRTYGGPFGIWAQHRPDRPRPRHGRRPGRRRRGAPDTAGTG